MKVLILAGGFGTRLESVGVNVPKGLIPYQNSKIINFVIDDLTVNGCQEITVISNEKFYGQYEQWAALLPQKITVINDHVMTSEKRLGALGDLQFAIQSLGWQYQSILVCPSDTFFKFPLSTFIHHIEKYPDDFSTIVRQMDISLIKNRLGCAVMGEGGLIKEFIEKPENPSSPYGAIPFYYYPASTHKLLEDFKKEGNSMDAPGTIIPWLLKNDIPVRACVVEDETIDVGTPHDLQLLSTI